MPGFVVRAVALAAVDVQMDCQAFGDVAEADVVRGVRKRFRKVEEVAASRGWGLEAVRCGGEGRVHAPPTA